MDYGKKDGPEAGIFPAWSDFPKIVKDRWSLSFEDWSRASLIEMTALRDYLRVTFPTGDPGALAQDVADTQVHLATSNERHAAAVGYRDKAQALAERKLAFEDQIAGNAAQRQGKGFVSDFYEEEGAWGAISSTLQERLWSARNEMKTFQGPEYRGAGSPT